jgi:hypothetical protein
MINQLAFIQHCFCPQLNMFCPLGFPFVHFSKVYAFYCIY